MIKDIDAQLNMFHLDEKRLTKAKNYAEGHGMGRKAFHAGVRFHACPLDHRDPRRKGWRKGWKFEFACDKRSKLNVAVDIWSKINAAKKMPIINSAPPAPPKEKTLVQNLKKLYKPSR